MTRTRTFALLTLFAFASSAQALKLTVWDPELQLKVGYGETNGSRMTVQLVKDYSGPVKVVFSREEDEKARSVYPSLQSSYPGTLKAGQLTLEVGNTTVTLSRFLSGLKLTLTSQPAGQVFSLPGLRNVTDKTPPDRPAQGDR